MTTKICHVTTMHNRYDDRIYQKECISLAKQYETYLLVNDKYEDEVLNDVHIVSMNIQNKGRLYRILNHQDILKKALSIDAEIYHLHDPELLLIAKKLLVNNKKVIFDSHEYYYEQIATKEYIPKLLRKAIALLYYNYETYVCSKINAVISVCPLRKKDGSYNPFKGRCRRHEYIANYPKKRKIARENKEEANDIYTICYAGGLTPERGIGYLMDACYKANCKLLLAGTFSSDNYHNQLKAKESYKCVEYKGQCTQDQVFELYNNSDVGASTLLDYGQYFKIETFPVKVYEYLQTGLPVIVSNSEYNVQMIDSYKFGIAVDPEDVKEISDAIIYLRDNKDITESMSENGQNIIEKYFNWDIEKEKLYLLYNNIISGNS